MVTFGVILTVLIVIALIIGIIVIFALLAGGVGLGILIFLLSDLIIGIALTVLLIKKIFRRRH